MVDFNLEEGKPIENNDVKLLLQQIDLLFDTTPGEVFGDPSFGTEYDHYMYNFNLDNSAMQEMIVDDLHSLNLLGFTPSCQVYFLEGTEQDIAIIDITLKRNELEYKKTYKIT